MPGEMQGEDRPKVTRRPGACQLCRQKKTRCNGEKQCNLCQRHGLPCVYEVAGSSNIEHGGYWPSSPAATEALCAQCKEPQYINRGANCDNAISVASWKVGTDAGPFGSDFGGIFFGDEQSTTFDHNIWAGRADVPSLSTLLSTSTRTCNDESVDSANTDYASLTGKGGNYAVYPGSAEMELDLSLLGFAPTTPSTFAVSRKRKCVDGITAEDEPNLLGRPRLHATDILANFRSVAFPALQIPPCNGVTFIPQSPHVDALLTLMSSSKLSADRRHKMANLVRRLLCQKSLVGMPAHWNDELNGVVLSRCELQYKEPLVERLIERCFQDPSCPQMLLDQGEFMAKVRLWRDACDTSMHTAETEVLIHALAFWGSMLESSADPQVGCLLLMRIQGAWNTLLLEPQSIGKFIALVVLVQLTQRFGISFEPSVVAQTVALMQTLKPHCRKARQQLCPDVSVRERVVRALQLFFSADRRNVLRWESFSSLPAYIIPSAAKSTPEDAVPSSKNAGQHWPDIQYRYGCIVDSILQARQAEDQTCASSKILDDLSSWYKSVADGQHEPNRSPVTTSSARHAAISSSYQYHEAVLSVLLHESVSDTQGTQMEIPQSIVMESIRDIFSASNLIENHLYDRTLLYVPALAICILAVQQLVAQTPSAGSLREGRTLLAMALGFFGRLSSVLPSPDYFDLVVELVDFVGLSNTGVHS